MRCHACGFEVAIASGDRVGFHDSCEGCRRDLHTCLNCAFYDPDAYNQCHETNAERVSDRERGNRCEYFSPGSRAGGEEKAGAARDALDSLFKK